MSRARQQAVPPGGFYACALVYFGAAAAMLLAHAPYLKLPFFWDELGQFVPAALDIFRSGRWVPVSTVPNVHPPGVMAYVAAVWKLFGYSIEATRAAMLFLGACVALIQVLLAAELCGSNRRWCALYAAALLAVSPLFFAQSMMVQLDMPAMLFTGLALLLFVRNRVRAAAVACLALVLVKETGAIVPALFGAWLVSERRGRDAAWFLMPLAALGGWLAVLRAATGEWFGNPEFTEYNLFYPLHPFRLAVNVARRLYFLLFENFHWVGAIAVALAWRSGAFRSRAWRVSATLALLHVAALSAAGGAALERYLLPVLPVIYAAFSASLERLKDVPRAAARTALAAGLVAGNFWNPPYPFPFENNLAFADFVRLHESAARKLEEVAGRRAVVTAWPLSAALRRPEYGYVRTRLRVRTLTDFSPANVDRIDPRAVEVFVLYSRDSEPGWGLLRHRVVADLRRRFYDYEPQVTGAEVRKRFALERAARWERRGQWIEIYVRPPA